MLAPFHYAFPVTDLAATREFYEDMLGALLGRSTEQWSDFDLYGHQLSAHKVNVAPSPAAMSEVDGVQVPIPHFGVVLEWGEWQALAERLIAKQVPFLLKPKVRFAGAVGEQGTFFVQDPSGNTLEFKSFKRSEEMFA
ncbi:MAG TPA: VOC family protein [Alcanivoracaceae bacterium]|nr:VOC family protein [Alcanivoracaceae bacterium]